MESNPNYFRGEPKIKRIVLTAVEDENARVALLEKGTVDAAGIVPKLADRVRKNGNYNVSRCAPPTPASPRCPTATPCCATPPCGARWRYAVDRQKIVDSALAGAGEPAYGPIMKDHWAYSPVAERPFDPAKAARLLDAAGWTRSGDATRTKGARSSRSRSCTRPTTASARTSRSRSPRR